MTGLLPTVVSPARVPTTPPQRFNPKSVQFQCQNCQCQSRFLARGSNGETITESTKACTVRTKMS